MTTDQPNSPRRAFLRKAGIATAVATVGSTGIDAAAAEYRDMPPEVPQSDLFERDPFTLGIASGDPLPNAVVLWTRLAPEPLAEDGGMADREVPVKWEVATDEGMTDIVSEGSVTTNARFAHSVHVDVTGLEPDTTYYYRFESGTYQTAVGTTETAPPTDADLDAFDFAFVSCQDWPKGYYTAYDHLAEEDIELVVHLGDYIYGKNIQTSLDRSHEPPHELESLGDYRIRYSQYKTDESLQKAHAAFPWIVTWDDHEVVNNYAGDDYKEVPHDEFLERRTNAYQAFFEHQPLRLSRMPDGPNLPLYRRFSFGNLLEFSVLDTRQYRDDIVSEEERTESPDRTILGDEQREWLLDWLDESGPTWNVLANQVLMAEIGISNDWWDGYEADRQAVLDTMAGTDDLNPVVLTGDIHRNYVYDLKADFSNPDSRTVATEFVGTSLTSGMNGTGITQYGRSAREPWQRFFSDHRGYVRCTVTPNRWRSDYRVVSTVEDRDASVRTLASFVTEPGSPGAKPVSDLPDRRSLEITEITRGKTDGDTPLSVTVRNTGSERVDLSGFRLGFQSGALRVPTNDPADVYTFDGPALDAGDTITVRAGEGEDTESVVYTGQDSAPDRAVFVADSDGVMLDEETYPELDSGTVSIPTETRRTTESATVDTTATTLARTVAETARTAATPRAKTGAGRESATNGSRSGDRTEAATAESANTTGGADGDSSTTGPGFGVLAALVGLGGIALRRLRR
ncbi:alkaline phosphatase D family protein [Halococcus sp. IIIV-5B]|uniref:alkaline phosphatase D family protein n=1 Tax=Halococcus sp. IIIV-5B TaxID=2321230 RepID=UPI000E71D655|nr:alkaline phosphatase D family protein [Halococcus sp. IIIV-5B]RJT05510.1 PGF-CTERM sorting domain-containing protein [Halococcus sp. IIIV-5B]